MFLGEFQHTLDGKLRLAIPSELRKRWDPAVHGEELIASPGPNGALWLWPEKLFERLAGELGTSLRQDAEMADFQRKVFSQSAALSIDSAGRIRIPDRMLMKHGLSGTIVVIGAGHHMELFSSHGWERECERLNRA